MLKIKTLGNLVSYKVALLTKVKLCCHTYWFSKLHNICLFQTRVATQNFNHIHLLCILVILNKARKVLEKKKYTFLI